MDDELFPWALAQAVFYLEENQDVDAVAGMYLRDPDSCLLTRVRGGKKVIKPADYLQMDTTTDCIGAVRRIVVEEWLSKRTDYFAMEFHQWFTFSLKHNQLYVDEPSAKVYTLNTDRVSRSEGRTDDSLKFIEEHVHYIKDVESPGLTRMLFGMWWQMLKTGNTRHRKIIEEYLKARNLCLWELIIRKLYTKSLRLLRSKKTAQPGVQYL